MDSPDRQRSLSRVLGDWHVAPTRNPRFRAAVRSRLGAARQAAPWTGYVRLHAPAVAGALVVALVAGAWFGRIEARARVAADRDQIARAYVQSLDARTMRP